MFDGNIGAERYQIMAEGQDPVVERVCGSGNAVR